MKPCKSFVAAAFALLILISGCSKNDGNDKTQSNANATDTNPPQNDAANTVNDTMDNMMSYLQQKGITLDDMKTLDDMDFAAHEGRSFTYQGNTAYLYRLKENDESMKALLDSAKNSGTVKVNINGERKDYAASVNGNYLLVYQKEAKMDDFIQLFDTYQAGIGGIDASDQSGSATENGNAVNSKKQTGEQNNSANENNQNKTTQNNNTEEPMD